MASTNADLLSEQQHGSDVGRRAHEGLAIRSLPDLKKDSSRESLSSLALLDVLDVDDRPTFILDLDFPPVYDAPLEPVYANPALARQADFYARLTRRDTSRARFADNLQPYSRFRRWLYKSADDGTNVLRGSAYLFEGYFWTATIVNNYKVVSGIQSLLTRHGPSSTSQGPLQPAGAIDPREHKEPKTRPQFVQERLPTVPPYDIDSKLATPPSESARDGPYDYTREPPPSEISDHVKYFRSVDWAQTSLGPMTSWKPEFRTLVNMILHDTHPAVLFWGDEVIMIYNEAYIEIIGVLHPCMGTSARITASEYWVHFQPLVDHINATGQTLSEQDLPLFLDRHGFLEETYFSFQLIPVLSNGRIAGYFQPLIETTRNKLFERRVSSLVEVGSQTAKARDLKTYWNLVLNTLQINDKDAPFALVYSAERVDGIDLSSMSSPGTISDVERCLLQGAIGVPIDGSHPMAPSVIDLKDSQHFFLPYLQQAAQSGRPTLVHFDDVELSESMLANVEWKGYGDACRSVIICPIIPTTREQVQGFLMVGINPRRPFDDEYQQFVHVMNRLLATSLASVVLFEEEMRQKEIAIGQAARMQEQLLAELKLTEKKFQRFAERADIAIFTIAPTGEYTYRNDRWYDLFKSVEHMDDVSVAWTRIAFPEDLAYCESLFAKLVVDKVPITFELKTRNHWTPPRAAETESDDQEHYVWILCSAYPELGPDNELKEIVGNVTDISKQKWAEQLQRVRTDSALESKKQLENFIDSTSHEIRNPLSAIMQCADGILSSYSTTVNPEPGAVPSPTSYANLLDQTLDAAHTIAQCAQHMKHLVDDILTISKLDSGLLVITPIDAQPESVAHHAVRMFESEAGAAGVEMRFVVDQSYSELGVDWVSLDPTRLLQVLINLITNAIKFTRLESKRVITVTIAASIEEPKSTPGGVQFTEERIVTEDARLAEDWKHGSTIYLQFSVSDTGRGLSDEEKDNLFVRFSQASPRTHIHYGGSGLGLFISRRMTELQGGSIGLASKYKAGSTFSFYVKARRSMRPEMRRTSVPEIFPEDIKHRPSTSKEINKMIRAPPLIRAQSAIHTGVPIQALGHSAEVAIEEEGESNVVPEILHVLVVEDNLVNQKVLAKQLRNLGCVVSVANHGGEALAYIKKTKFWNRERGAGQSPLSTEHSTPSTSPNRRGRGDLQPSSVHLPKYVAPDSPIPLDLSIILMDWEMPTMNGLTATKRIRELERDHILLGHIPVIGVTANVRQQQIQTALEAGMDDVVGKPFRVADLLARMKGVVAGGVVMDNGNPQNPAWFAPS